MARFPLSCRRFMSCASVHDSSLNLGHSVLARGGFFLLGLFGCEGQGGVEGLRRQCIRNPAHELRDCSYAGTRLFQ